MAGPLLGTMNKTLVRAYFYAKTCANREGDFAFWRTTNGRWVWAEYEWIATNVDLKRHKLYSPRAIIKLVEEGKHG